MQTPSISFFACHAGPAQHFATFSEKLKQQGYTVLIYASGPAVKKFKAVDRTISDAELAPANQDQLAENIAKACLTSVMITDVGHEFDIKLQQALNLHAKNVVRVAYYDNPENFVPIYSSVAAEVMLKAQGILFANNNLAQEPVYSEEGKEINFGVIGRFGIGYYPVEEGKKLVERRKNEHEAMRSSFLDQNKIKDNGQKVMVYFGGNNEEYFDKAFPAFLDIVEQTSNKMDNAVILLQQHPGAKSKNEEQTKITAWQQNGHGKNVTIILSNISSEDAQVLAEIALYYQTSMSPQFALAKIPTIQIGHKKYNDILVRNNLAPSVTDVDQFATALSDINSNKILLSDDTVLKGLGFRENWNEALQKAIREATSLKSSFSLIEKKISSLVRQIPTNPMYLAAASAVLFTGLIALSIIRKKPAHI